MGSEAGGDLAAAIYSPSSVNRYYNRTVPGVVGLSGVADASAVVRVNSRLAYRKGEYFYGTLNYDNGYFGYAYLSMSATIDSPWTAVSGFKFLPQSPEVFWYDLDGNPTQGGLRLMERTG